MVRDSGWEYINIVGDEIDINEYFSDGTISEEADGSIYYSGWDGSYGYKYPDGSVEYNAADGGYGSRDADGKCCYTDCDGNTEYFDFYDTYYREHGIIDARKGLLRGIIKYKLRNTMFDLDGSYYNNDYDDGSECDDDDEDDYDEDEEDDVDDEVDESNDNSGDNLSGSSAITWEEFKRGVKKFFISITVISIIGVILFGIYRINELQKRIAVGFSSDSIIGLNYELAVEMAKKSGFTNIYANPKEDLSIDEIAKEYTVASIAIKNVGTFTSTSLFPYDSEIVIYYHMVKDVFVPASAKECTKMNIDELMQLLKDAGFVNISKIPEYDLINGWIVKVGSVKDISINGEMKFEKSSKFRPDVEVVITYHELKKNKPEK